MPWARARTPKIPPDTVPPRRVALDMTHTSQGPALLRLSHLYFCQWERSFYWKLRCHWLEFLRQRQIAAERQGRSRTPASQGAVLQRARRMYVWRPAQQMDNRANKCDVTIGNDMTSQSRKDLRRCVLSHWRFIQLLLRVVIISHWMLLHNSWTLYVSTNPSIYLHVYVVYFPRNGRTQHPHLRSVNVTVTSSWTFCFAGTTTRCSSGIDD